MQISFDPLDYPYHLGAKQALKDRNERARSLRAQGKEVSCWTLANQIRPYSGLGQSDGRIRNVYYINVR